METGEGRRLRADGSAGSCVSSFASPSCGGGGEGGGDTCMPRGDAILTLMAAAGGCAASRAAVGGNSGGRSGCDSRAMRHAAVSASSIAASVAGPHSDGIGRCTVRSEEGGRLLECG